jgi:secernin
VTGCDAVVARGRATVGGQTYFGHNSDGPADGCHALCRQPGREFTLGEKVQTQRLTLDQVRQTCTVLGSQPAGSWGYSHGVNEHGLALGQAVLRTRLPAAQPGLMPTDLVRLALERAYSAQQAVDFLTDLVHRHGMGAGGNGEATPHDCSLLIADAEEAFVLETAGNFWVVQEVQEVRSISNVSLVRQDWDRIATGLAGLAIDRGWWPCDGSKLDFAGSVCPEPMGHGSALRRWGRATYLLEQQSGHIDAAFCRRLLSDHYEGMHSEVDPLWKNHHHAPLCQHAPAQATAASLVASLGQRPATLQVAWCAFGPPCVSVYFPILLQGELPEPFTVGGRTPRSDSCWWRIHRLVQQLQQDPARWTSARAAFSRLQTCFDQETEEFLAEMTPFQQTGQMADLQRRCTLFMQHCLECFEALWLELSDRRASIQSPSSV